MWGLRNSELNCGVVNHPRGITLNFFYLIAVIYFFFNSVFLPLGLLYTTILAPVFYVWLLYKRENFVATKFLFVALPFTLLPLIFNRDVDYFIFFRSVVLYFLLYITIYAATIRIKIIKNPHLLFRKLINLNFIFCIMAIVSLMTPYAEAFWTVGTITQGVDETARLSLFTYEPSYYATLMVPLVCYSIVYFLHKTDKIRFRYLLFSLLPFALTASLGVISGMLIAVGLTSVFKSRQFRPVQLATMALLVFVTAILLFTVMGDDLIIRIQNVFLGYDTSFSARTDQSNHVAMQIMDASSWFWGAGFGQSKLLATGFFDEYWFGLDVNRLTNVVAATAAEFGILGLIFRFFVEFWFFFRTRVYASYFRLILFLFAFIYQFTGSFTTNIAEYMIWIFAFIPVFHELETCHFNVRRTGLNNVIKNVL